MAEKKRPLVIDFNKLLVENDSFDPPEILRVKKKKPFSGDEVEEEIEKMNNEKLGVMIIRLRGNMKHLAAKLPDKGERLMVRLRKMEAEQRRRVQYSFISKSNKPTAATSNAGIFSSGFKKEGAPSPMGERRDPFAQLSSIKLDDNRMYSSGNAFERELSTLGSSTRYNKNNYAALLPKSSHNSRSSPMFFPLHSPSTFYSDKDKPFLPSGDHKGKTFPDKSGSQWEENFFRSYAKGEDNYQLQEMTKKNQTILLVDDEEPENRGITEQIEHIPESLRDARIYYPSRDDPDSVEICYTDTKCLDPQTNLTSAIMNFYIRNLDKKASSTDKGIHAFHFFNTFFYNKLKNAVSEQGTVQNNSFVKLRRWWKGVDMFQKAYIFIPINEKVHWSLVIICIPDKEEESGPLVLHLDSLGIHCSKSIFRIIKSFLKEEWSYKEEFDIFDLTVSDCWKRLPDHIEEISLPVPQQKNDYDCGLFVLLFMERFIEDAPGRLTKNNLSMFSRQWFQPEEASWLRRKIRNLLEQEFEMASKTDYSKEPPLVIDFSEDETDISGGIPLLRKKA